jgi:RNA-directed DNA polymerase
MKRIGHLFDNVCAADNLYSAYRKARKGKRNRPDVVKFELNLETELQDLREALINQTYTPGPFKHFTIYERKARLISVAPFRDRVLHHAIMNELEPVLDKRLVHDCYACRVGKGVHKAIDRYQHYANRYAYELKLDVQKFFPSIDHHVLKNILRRRLKDPRLLALLAQIVDHAPEDIVASPLVYFAGDDLLTPIQRPRGLPIGNLTSQVFANVYLDDLDHWVKEVLQVDGYIRYMDDLFLFGDDKTQLWAVRSAIDEKLASLRLRLRGGKTQLFQTNERLDVLGVTASRQRRWLRNDNGHRFIRRYKNMLRKIRTGLYDRNHVRASIQSWIGHACHGETNGLRIKIFNQYPLYQAVREGIGRKH